MNIVENNSFALVAKQDRIAGFLPVFKAHTNKFSIP